MIGAALLAVTIASSAASASVAAPRVVPPVAVGTAAAAQVQAAEVIAEVRVHGNHLTPDDEVVQIAGVVIGAPFTATSIAEITARLRASDRFDTVEVLKRFASIEDLSKIVVVMIVNEGPVRIVMPTAPGQPARVLKRRGLRNLMFMPLIDAEDGYGLTYGVRLAYLGVAGGRSRLSFPLTWGGFKRAGIELDRTFGQGPFSRVEVGASIDRRRNPAYEEEDDRKRVWGRFERAAGPVRASVTGMWQRIGFGSLDEDVRSIGGAIAFDTRLDPILPRNAVFATAAVDRCFFDAGDPITRTRLDGRGYIGVVGQTVLEVRVLREDASAAVPVYMRSLLGGWSNLRGFKAGFLTGDTLVAGSLELRVPLSSPLDIGKMGVSLFVDSGTAYDKGQRFRDQPLHTGAGGSVWLAVAAFRMSLAVAHGRGSGTRISFGGGFMF